MNLLGLVSVCSFCGDTYMGRRIEIQDAAIQVAKLTLLSPIAERTGQRHHSTLDAYVHQPKRTSYFQPCFLQKSSASACVWKFSVARPTLSRGSAVEVHPIKGFSHLHAMNCSDFGVSTVKGQFAIRILGEQGARENAGCVGLLLLRLEDELPAGPIA